MDTNEAPRTVQKSKSDTRIGEINTCEKVQHMNSNSLLIQYSADVLSLYSSSYTPNKWVCSI